MPSIHETVYPRLKSYFSETELNTTYKPTHEELLYAAKATKTSKNKFFFLASLKTFQRLGYFISLNSVPNEILVYIANELDIFYDNFDFETYDKSRLKRYHYIVAISVNIMEMATDVKYMELYLKK